MPDAPDHLRAIDCDVHIPSPAVRELLPFMPVYWRDMVKTRGISQLDLASFGRTPYACGPLWQDAVGLQSMRAQLLDAFPVRFAIASCLSGALGLHSEDLATVLVSATNDWVARAWLDEEPRLRASILVYPDAPARAATEIDRMAQDSRFVQVVLLVAPGRLLGKRSFWPIFEAAQRHDLPVAIHAGSNYHQPPNALGWPSYAVDEQVGQAAAFQTQLISLIAEGVFSKFPNLRVVLQESGFAWLPNFIWRANKTWKGVRTEVPWVDRSPADIVRKHVRLTLRPTDEPPTPSLLEATLDQIGSGEMLLFSSDYPHWHFDRKEDFVPPELPVSTHRSILVENPLRTYPRLAT